MITVREWIQKFNAGDFDKPNSGAGWYDWFCDDSQLPKRLKAMGNVIKDIKNDFILDNYYVWFKDNCPCCYPLFDDFRLEPITREGDDEKTRAERRNALYFGVDCGHPFGSEFKYEIFTARNGYEVEFKCKNKWEVLRRINQLASDFEKLEI